MPAKQRKPLGESLVEDGIITQEQLMQAKKEEERSGQRLRNVIVRMGFISEEDLVEFLSNRLSVPKIDLSNYLIDPKIIELVPEDLARKHELIPLLKIGNRLTCVMVDPSNVFALDEVRARTDLIIEPAVATESEIKKALAAYYGVKGSMEDVIKSIDAEKLGLKEGSQIDTKKLEGIVEEPVVIKLVNLIIMKAVQEGASDIHLEPEESALRMRFRIDGMMYDASSPPKHLQSAITSRIKIMANLDIAERRIPQDGRFSIKIESRDIDVRVSCVPTIYGENVVLRLLDVSSAVLSLEKLGFSKENFQLYQKLVLRPHGMILVTGPTGSGKTTTLYASLNTINTPEKNIITIEDPVEYRLSGIRQIQVNPKVGLTFANGLRSILRQDPNVIMVGEIRDFDTAEIAIQAALTGHLVFSTLHTNNAASAVARLIDMGVEPFLISSSVIAVLAQRLVRQICKDCKEEYIAQKDMYEDLGLSGVKLYRGRGCAKCMSTGYKGRIGLYELMIPDEELRGLIAAKASIDQLKKQGRASGMISLREDGILKVKEGLTTPEEALRVIEEQ